MLAVPRERDGRCLRRSRVIFLRLCGPARSYVAAAAAAAVVLSRRVSAALFICVVSRQQARFCPRRRTLICCVGARAPLIICVFLLVGWVYFSQRAILRAVIVFCDLRCVSLRLYLRIA